MYEWREVMKLSEQDIVAKEHVQEFLKLFNTDANQAREYLIGLVDQGQYITFVELWLGLLASSKGDDAKQFTIHETWRQEPGFQKAIRSAFGTRS